MAKNDACETCTHPTGWHGADGCRCRNCECKYVPPPRRKLHFPIRLTIEEITYLGEAVDVALEIDDGSDDVRRDALRDVKDKMRKSRPR